LFGIPLHFGSAPWRLTTKSMAFNAMYMAYYALYLCKGQVRNEFGAGRAREAVSLGR